MFGVNKVLSLSMLCLFFVLSSCEGDLLGEIDGNSTDPDIVAESEIEIEINTDDSDNDQYSNALEIQLGTDPTDPLDFPDDADLDRIPDVLDVYPFDVSRSKQKATINIVGVNHDLQVNVLDQTLNYTQGEQLELFVNNLDFEIEIVSEYFNEYSRCELIDKTSEFDFEYKCGTWLTQANLNEIYIKEGRGAYCIFENDQVPLDEFYAEEIQSLNCVGLNNEEIMSYFINVKEVLLHFNSDSIINFDIATFPSVEVFTANGSGVNILVTKCESLISLNLLVSLESINLSECNNLEEFNAPYQSFVDEIEFGEISKIKTIKYTHSNTKLDISNFVFLEELVTTADITVSNELLNLKILDLSYSNVIDVDFGLFENLETLSISKSEVSDVDVSKMDNLKSLTIHKSNLENINLTNNLKLEILDVSENSLQILDLSQNIILKDIFANDNNISEINFLNSAQYNVVDLINNELSYIDLSGMSVDTYLDLSRNLFKKVDLRGSVKIGELSLSSNVLNELLIPTEIIIESIYIKFTSLTSIDFTMVKKLKFINLSRNKITDIILPMSKHEISFLNLYHNYIVDLSDSFYSSGSLNEATKIMLSANPLSDETRRKLNALNITQSESWVY
ncbi:MAG: hypothetical protein HRU38_23025 [Saccharospirillaceae bacterium]|nr:hypothetical protein [Pseudomonadales bacterium]NRB81497.1 hypothetical protein [Saccharospirillaceae bacterium]